MSNPNILMVTSITSQFDVHMPQLTSNFGKCTISNCSFKYLACLALIQLDQADYTVVWDTRHPYFYSFQCCHLQLLVIFFYICANVPNKTGPIHSWNTAISIFVLKYPRSKSLVGSKVKFILRGQHHINFISCQADNPFLRYNNWKIWPWKSKVKVIDRSKVKVI